MVFLFIMHIERETSMAFLLHKEIKIPINYLTNTNVFLKSKNFVISKDNQFKPTRYQVIKKLVIFL